MSASMFAMRYPGRAYKGVHQFLKKGQKMEPRWRYGRTFDEASDADDEPAEQQTTKSGSTATAGPPLVGGAAQGSSSSTDPAGSSAAIAAAAAPQRRPVFRLQDATHAEQERQAWLNDPAHGSRYSGGRALDAQGFSGLRSGAHNPQTGTGSSRPDRGAQGGSGWSSDWRGTTWENWFSSELPSQAAPLEEVRRAPPTDRSGQWAQHEWQQEGWTEPSQRSSRRGDNDWWSSDRRAP